MVINQMPVGHKQFTEIARELSKDNLKLLILDEPLHGLDLANRALVKEIIQTFSKRQNKTLVMVTHYKEELPPCFNHEIFLKRNK